MANTRTRRGGFLRQWHARWMESLRPHYKRRQSRLRQALLNYPLYDPPHKGEERVLPVEQALENFRYFMDVRKERGAYFMQWLRDEFGVDASLEPAGTDATLDWARDYVPVIMPFDNRDRDPAVYYGRAEPWIGDYAGANAFVDLGAMLGEAIILRRPHLRWQMEWSMSDYPGIEQTADAKTMTIFRCYEQEMREIKEERWSGYRRPIIASASDPVVYEPVYGFLDTYFFVLAQHITVKAAFREATEPQGLRSDNFLYLRDWFERAASGARPPGLS